MIYIWNGMIIGNFFPQKKLGGKIPKMCVRAVNNEENSVYFRDKSLGKKHLVGLRKGIFLPHLINKVDIR